MDQLSGISKYRDTDVLSGRGSAINNHQGNRFFQSLVKALRTEYVATAKVNKPIFATKIVEHIRGLNPPGRFLKQDPKTKLWYDIGNKKALEKTRQALREGAPDLAKHIQEGSVIMDVHVLEQMISNHAKTAFDNMHIQSYAMQHNCSNAPNISTSRMTTQQNHYSTNLPNSVHHRQEGYDSSTKCEHHDSLLRVDENSPPSDSKRIFDPAEGKFVDFRFSHTSTDNLQHETSPDDSDSIRQSFPSHATYSSLVSQNIAPPYSEDWNLPASNMDPQIDVDQPNMLQRQDSSRYYGEYDQTVPHSLNDPLNRNSNDWRSRNSLFLKNIQEKIHAHGFQDFDLETRIGRSSAMVYNVVTELNNLGENSQKEQFLPSSTVQDEELSNLRSSLDSTLSISAMRSSLSMSEVFQSSTVQNPNTMSLSSRHSQEMSLVLRQSFLSEWVDTMEMENESQVKNKSLYVPDVFGSKVDKRRDVITESSQQLLEAVFGSDLYEDQNIEFEKELLRNILNPYDEMMTSSVGMDISGIWRTG